MKKILLASALAVVAASASIAPSQAQTMVVRPHHRHHCETRLVTHWRHHHKVIEKVKVCR
nr:hypothetical protein [Mesorhizobium sp.]